MARILLAITTFWLPTAVLGSELAQSPVTVVQTIEGTLTVWEELAVPDGLGGRATQIRLVHPEERWLTLEESQAFLETSADWMAGDQRPDTAHAAPRSVIGSDQRTRVTETSAHPWRAIAFINVTFPSGAQARGTAFLVGPTTLLTNAHLLWNRENGGLADEVEVSLGQTQPARDGEVNRPLGSINASDWVVCPDYTTSEQTSFDYAAIFLSEPADTNETTMPLAFDEVPTGEVHMAGYPQEVDADHSSYAMWHSVGQVVDVESQLVFHTADSSSGNSGGPIWQVGAAGDLRAVGIHSFGQGDANGGPRLVAENRALIMEWLTQSIGDSDMTGPDLVIQQITDPGPLVQDEPFDVTVVVSNDGTDAVGRFVVGINDNCTNLTEAIASLPAGETATVTFTGLSLDTDGTLPMRFTVDSCDAIHEAVESNNSKTLMLHVENQLAPNPVNSGCTTTCGACTPLSMAASLLGGVGLGRTRRGRSPATRRLAR